MVKQIVILTGMTLLIALSVFGMAGGRDDHHEGISMAEVLPFQPAGDFGGGVLTPGDMFPPTGKAKAVLKRSRRCLESWIHTTGLPPGAYTVWWGLVNRPENCVTPGCANDVIMPGTAAEAAVFWATGGEVGADGRGRFHSRVCKDDDLGFPGALFRAGDELIGPQNVLGVGLTNPKGARVIHFIKYHGPSAADPVVLYDQTHTLQGSCASGANGIDTMGPFGIQCFDPQFVIFEPPEEEPDEDDDED